jgi:hypothetical protein
MSNSSYTRRAVSKGSESRTMSQEEGWSWNEIFKPGKRVRTLINIDCATRSEKRGNGEENK